MTSDKRRHTRIDSLNLSYVCIDENNIVVHEGMGRTLNVSESGILLEIHFYAEITHYLSLTIAFDDELVDIRGKIVHSRTGRHGTYEAGIEFVEMDEQGLRTLKKYIKLFREYEDSGQ
ncbi:MAG: PilZ domain-containing protein [Desulfobacterales bacterium]|nr:PilZ domain-containing protein [Desulfobacterales bacterium]